MQLLPLKAPLKPPRVDAWRNSLLSERQNTIGNSLTLTDTEARELLWINIFGETLATPADPGQPVSPDNPQTLTSLTSFDYTVSGRNQFDKSATPSITSASTSIAETDTGITVSNTAIGSRYKGFVISVKAGLTYHISASSTRTGTTGGGIMVFTYTGSLGGSLGGNASTLNPDFSFVAPSSGQVAVLFYSNASTEATASATFSYVQLEVGSVKTAWAAYQAPVTASITLKDTSGNALEDRGLVATYNTDGSAATFTAQDRVFRDVDGKYKLQSNTAKVVLNGSENWRGGSLSTGSPDYVYCYLNAYDNSIARGSNVFMVDKMFALIGDQIVTGSVVTQDTLNIANFDQIDRIRIMINKTKLSSQNLSGFKTWLASNNITLIYTPIASTTTELHSDNQTAFTAAAKSFDGITNIMLSTSIGRVQVEQWSRESTR